MSMPTNAEILALLDQLGQRKCGDDLETEWLDFKAYNDPKEEKRLATEYAVCFANAGGGVVVFGVTDKEKGGRARAITGTKAVDLDQWVRDIYQNPTPHLTVQVEELGVPEGTGCLLVLRVPKGDRPPYGTSAGVFKKRLGTNCMPMDFHAEARIQFATGVVDWSGQAVEEAGDEVIDSVEVARARNILRRIKPNSELLRVGEREFLQGVRAIHDGKVTRTGLLLFGKEDELERRCPQHVVQYVYVGPCCVRQPARCPNLT